MATPSHITMLREISAAGDRERTGALDVEWEGAHATLFFMFGHPSHIVFETGDGRKLAGEDALDALVDELPAEFRVSPWRRAMVTDDTLHCSAEDLMGLFQRRTNVESNGHAAAPPAAEPPAPPVATALASAPVTDALIPPAAPTVATEGPPFGMVDFPLLPQATVLWTDAAANIANLEAAVPRLPDSLVVMSGPVSQGVALLAGGRVVDAVWVSTAGGLLGEEAARAVLGSTEGTLTAYRADDARLLAALPMLWRSASVIIDLPGSWLEAEDVVAEVRTSGRTCALVVDSAVPGIALFEAGELVAVYTAAERRPATSIAALHALLHEPTARVRVLGPPAEAAYVVEDAGAPTTAVADAAGPLVVDGADAAGADAAEPKERRRLFDRRRPPAAPSAPVPVESTTDVAEVAAVPAEAETAADADT
ncbi:MAG: hypothetical protein M3Z83_07910, partial [Actinomycetota bacterium]|nr:hypothetical protein [Actinomycetota bacterium]